MTAAGVLFTVAVLAVFVAAIVDTAICARAAVEADAAESAGADLRGRAAVTPFATARDGGADLAHIRRAA